MVATKLIEPEIGMLNPRNLELLEPVYDWVKTRWQTNNP
jgi:hypothetical protein